LRVVRLAVEVALRRASRLSTAQRTDILFVWPLASLYLRLVRYYEKALRGLWLRHGIKKRLHGPSAAREFRAIWEKRDDETVRALLYLGAFAGSICYAYRKAKLHAAAREQSATPGHEGPATQEAFEHFHLIKALSESHLSGYRCKVRGELDPAALWEAYCAADEAARSAIDELLTRVRQSGDLHAYLAALPFGPAGAIAANTKSVFRAAYRSEAPRWMVSSIAELVRPTDPEQASADPDPEEALSVVDAGRGASRDLAERLVWRETEREARSALERQVRAQLKPKQQQAVFEYWRGLEQGYGLSAKLGNSLRQRWGADYDRKQRMLHRVRGKHPELLQAIESFADSRPRRRSR